jgi:hypothetical protein
MMIRFFDRPQLSLEETIKLGRSWSFEKMVKITPLINQNKLGISSLNKIEYDKFIEKHFDLRVWAKSDDYLIYVIDHEIIGIDKGNSRIIFHLQYKINYSKLVGLYIYQIEIWEDGVVDAVDPLIVKYILSSFGCILFYFDTLVKWKTRFINELTNINVEFYKIVNDKLILIDINEINESMELIVKDQTEL